MQEIINRYEKLLEKINPDTLHKEAREIESEASSPSFWQDHNLATKKMTQLSEIQKQIEDLKKLEDLISEGNEKEANLILEKLELTLFFSGEYDSSSPIVS